MINDQHLWEFICESNHIEGISPTRHKHVEAHRVFLASPVTVESLCALVSVLQPDAELRDRPEVPNVRVGKHVAPRSGPWIRESLEALLRGKGDPYVQHVQYETLHPFTDGNGRSGRALWLHRYVSDPSLDRWAVRRGFLHSWYYHSLARAR